MSIATLISELKLWILECIVATSVLFYTLKMVATDKCPDKDIPLNNPILMYGKTLENFYDYTLKTSRIDKTIKASPSNVLRYTI